MSTGSDVDAGGRPDLSLVIPCYNEEEVVPYTVRLLSEAFAAASHSLELVCVDNGSTDRTGEILRELRDEGLPIEPVTVGVNQGYGNGLLAGIPHANGEWIGFIPADGQVDAEDVVRLFDALNVSGKNTLGKVRRRFRMDGLSRKLVSIAYNAFVFCLWPRLGSIDVNGTPKVVHREVLERMQLQTQGWFFDPELMIKAHYMKLRVLEMNAFARMRGTGLSHVRASTCWEFFRELLKYRFTPFLRQWKQTVRSEPAVKATAPKAESQ